MQQINTDKFLIIILMVSICIISPVWGEEDSSVWFTGDISVAPFTYGTLFQMDSINVNLDCLLGYRLGEYSNGIEVISDQFFLNSRDADNPYKGSRFNTSLFFDSFYALSRFIRLKWGTGLSWTRDFFTYDEIDTEINDLFGLAFLFNIKILLHWQFIYLELMNRIDVLYTFDSEFNLLYMDPAYCGSLRINISPGIDWLNLYLKASGLYWSYSSQENQINTDLWQFAVGFIVDTRALEIQIKSDEDEADDPLAAWDRIESEYPELMPIRLGVVGDKITVNAVDFEPGKDVLVVGAYPFLDTLVKILKLQPELVISVSAYSEYTRQPEADYNLYLARTEKIQAYFLAKGIKPERVLLSTKGRIRRAGDQAIGSMLLEIIKKE